MDSTLANHFLLFTNPACVCIVDETWTNLFLLSELDIKIKIVHFGKTVYMVRSKVTVAFFLSGATFYCFFKLFCSLCSIPLNF